MDPSEFKRRADLLRQIAGQIERGEPPTVTNWNLEGLSPTRLREVAETQEHAPGARRRELLAQHLLLHQDELRIAAPEDRQVVKDYLKNRTWESMRETDVAMFQTLEAAIAKLDKSIWES
jgi:hypothetical protein